MRQYKYNALSCMENITENFHFIGRQIAPRERNRHRLCLLTKRSGHSENIQTDLSKEPEAKYLPSQLHPTLCTFAEWLCCSRILLCDLK